MVLHDGDDHLVAWLQDRATQAVGHEVEGLGGVAGKDDLACLGFATLIQGSDEGGDAGAGVVDGLSGRDGQAVETAQGIGVHGLVEALLGVQDELGTLRRGGRVQKRDVRVLRQQGEVLLVGVLLDVLELFGSQH